MKDYYILKNYIPPEELLHFYLFTYLLSQAEAQEGSVQFS